MEWRLIFRREGILEIRAVGTFNNGELSSIAKHIIMDPRWKDGMSIVADFRDIVSTDVKVSDLILSRKIHKKFENKAGISKIAVVIPHKSSFLVSLAYEAIADAHIRSKIKSFEDYKEGFDWVCGKKVIDLNDWRL